MKILMIGGNGFLGKHIQDELKEFDVWAPKRTEINWVTGDGIDLLSSFVPDVVIHLLAIYGGLPFCMNNRVRMALENLEINANVYRYLAGVRPKRLITMGSGCEYPGYRSGVLSEKDLGDGLLHRSVAHYGYSKLVQLEACRAMNEEYGTEFEHIVLANMYGPGDVYELDRSHVVGALIRKFSDAMSTKTPVNLMGTGKAVRDLVYVKDVAKLVGKLVRLESSTNQPLNASTGVGTSIRELAETISDVMDFKYGICWGEDSENGCLLKVLSTDLIEKVLGWKPSTSLRHGLEETIRWYNDNEHKI